MGNTQIIIGKINPTTKRSETVGKLKRNSVQFDDFDLLRNKFNYKLYSIKVSNNKEILTGIECVFKMDGKLVSLGQHEGNTPSTKKQTLTLADNEFIDKIIIKGTDTIEGMGIYTTSGNSLLVNTSKGTLTEFKVSNKEQMIAFSGSTSEGIDSLEIYVDAIY
jgi:hypothetical protein